MRERTGDEAETILARPSTSSCEWSEGRCFFLSFLPSSRCNDAK